MKGATNNTGHNNQQAHSNLHKPEIRDNLDSRKEKEDGYVDHNNKAGKKPNTKAKNKDGN